MIPKPLDEITADDIHALVDNAAEESRTLEFKRTLPGNSDNDRRELRLDVTSFANTAGGDLIYGIRASKGVAKDVVGLPDTDTDAEQLRIETVIRAGIDPRVPGVALKVIDIPDKAPVIVVRVQQSWMGPHFVKVNDAYRMVGRHGTGKYTLDPTEMRSAILLSEQLPERIRRWRDSRLVKVLGGESPVLLESAAYLVVHLLPLSSFTSRAELSVRDLKGQLAAFPPPDARDIHHRVNIDGVVTSAGSTGLTAAQYAYCQVFRSGRVEAVSTDIVVNEEGQRHIPSGWYENTMVRSITSYLGGLEKLGIHAPIVVCASISGAKGASMKAGLQHFPRGDNRIDRDMLLLPDVPVETYDVDVPTMLRPLFDALWNSAGWERSPNYNEAGKWTPKQ